MVLAAGGGFVLKLFEMQTPLTAGIYRLCHRLFAATTLCKPVAAPPPGDSGPAKLSLARRYNCFILRVPIEDTPGTETVF